jgi:hypothetical protein
MAYPFEVIEKERLWGLISSQISVRGITGEQYFVSTGVEHDDLIAQAPGFGIAVPLPPAGGDYALIEAANDYRTAELIRVTVDGWQEILDRIEFLDLYQQWKGTQNTLSSVVGDITRNPSYFRIVGMGRRALPSIFMYLNEETKSEEPDHWFPALSAITGANPVPAGKEGKIRDMAMAWLEWGRREGYLNAEGVGETISEPGKLDV